MSEGFDFLLPTDKEIDKDSFRTPPEIYRWLNSMFRFDIDLAADARNAHANFWFDKTTDALTRSWAKVAAFGFCNPPFSDVEPWVKKAAEEAENDFLTALYVHSPNGENYHRIAMESADELIIIHGRIAHLAPCDFRVPGKNGKPDKIYREGDPMPGNTRGSCVYVFRPLAHTCASEIRLRHVSRDWIFETYGESKERAA